MFEGRGHIQGMDYKLRNSILSFDKTTLKQVKTREFNCNCGSSVLEHFIASEREITPDLRLFGIEPLYGEAKTKAIKRELKKILKESVLPDAVLMDLAIQFINMEVRYRALKAFISK